MIKTAISALPAIEPALWSLSSPLKHMFGANFSEHDCKSTTERGERQRQGRMRPPESRREEETHLRSQPKGRSQFLRGPFYLNHFINAWENGYEPNFVYGSATHLSELSVTLAAGQSGVRGTDLF